MIFVSKYTGTCKSLKINTTEKQISILAHRKLMKNTISLSQSKFLTNTEIVLKLHSEPDFINGQKSKQCIMF